MDAERYWSHVDRRGDDECWPWTSSRLPKGHGTFWWDGKARKAHRIGYMLAYGEIPEGLHVTHNCYNAWCQNPRHLEAATHGKNHNDWDRTGDRHHGAVVPDCVVADIVRRYKAGGVTHRELAEELTALGWPTATVTVGKWIRGTARQSSS